MEKTKCLYDKFPYETEFDANVLVVKALNEAQDRYEVILDQTLFFPEQGGQTPDQGWLSVGHGLRPATKCEVLDVQIRDGVIVHVIEQKLEPGDQVHGQIAFPTCSSTRENIFFPVSCILPLAMKMWDFI